MQTWMWFAIGGAAWLVATLWFAWAMMMPKTKAEFDYWDDEYWPTDNPSPPQPDVPVMDRYPNPFTSKNSIDDAGDKLQGFDPMRRPNHRTGGY